MSKAHTKQALRNAKDLARSIISRINDLEALRNAEISLADAVEIERIARSADNDIDDMVSDAEESDHIEYKLLKQREAERNV